MTGAYCRKCGGDSFACSECIAATIRERIEIAKSRVEAADALARRDPKVEGHRINGAYHGGEVAGLNFALGCIEP